MPITTNILGGGIAFNEWLPVSFNTDYNGDGVASGGNDGYIEIVNTSTGPIDISGYTFYTFDNDAGVQAAAHVVPNGTILAAGEQYTLVSNNATSTATTASNIAGPSAIADFDFDASANVNWFLADPSGNFIVLQESGGDGFFALDLADAGLNPANQVGTTDVVDAPLADTSIARVTDGDDVFTEQTPSPGDPNCFLTGTLIDTPRGPRAVEDLAIGDLILTAAGDTIPVLWVGRQQVSTRFGPAERLMPVRVMAGALGHDLPRRDLTVTADHALVFDGLLVDAGALVNGSTIHTVPLAELGGSYTVYHIETEAHDVILAEGAPAESFIDYVGRQAFDNYAEYAALYGADRDIVEMTRPRITSARMLPAWLRDRLHRRDAA